MTLTLTLSLTLFALNRAMTNIVIYSVYNRQGAPLDRQQATESSLTASLLLPRVPRKALFSAVAVPTK